MSSIGQNVIAKRIAAVAVVIALWLPLSAYGAVGAGAAEPMYDVFGGQASTHIIVKFAVAAGPNAQAGDAPVAVAMSLTPRQRLNAAWGVTGMRPVFSGEFAYPALAARHGMDRMYILEVPQGSDTIAMAAAYRDLGGDIEYAEVDGVGGVALIPDDSAFNLLYGMHNVGQSGGTVDADIDAPEAWDIHTGDEGTVTVAIIDSGINPHTEYGNRLLSGTNTGNPGSPDLTDDDCGHGNHVAGIVGAQGNNGIGVAGVSWGVLLMPVRVVNPCTGTETHCADGIRWAVDHGADICNMSLQYYTGTQALESAVNYAHDAGVLLVGAAGNLHNPRDVVAFPARFENCIAVSATDRNDLRPSFSNYGDEIDLCAPGVGIWSTWNNGAYRSNDGTSMSTPHVSGVAALLASYEPDLTAEGIRALLTSTVDDIGPPGWDREHGYGRLNAHSALLAVDDLISIVSSDPHDGAIDAGQPFEVDGSDPAGWDRVTITFDGDVSNLDRTDFEVSQVGGVAAAPQVVAVNSLGFESVEVVLSDRLEVGTWTTIHHILSGASVTLGYLPGDVNGDATANPSDILDLIDSLNGVGDALPPWSTDVDRSGLADPSDILRVIDLLNGAGAYDPFDGVSLP